MKKEQWQKWKPLEEFPSKLWFDYLLQNRDGLKVQFESEDERKVEVIFGYSALTHRVTDEGDLLQTIDFWSSEYGNDFFSWSLYKSSNSSFIDWFHEESCEKFEDEAIEHYAFITPNEIIEVLSAIPPEIIISKKK
ncbi:hypothetical protein [Fictibacillus gelatini]|uniref:hypothetical protein n=1 Tax=Fictibacillus gelatini TaxID=225985 RepID=UPI00041BAF72|nr:hypothetical protein [Fictibacillus gelatini]